MPDPSIARPACSSSLSWAASRAPSVPTRRRRGTAPPGAGQRRGSSLGRAPSDSGAAPRPCSRERAQVVEVRARDRDAALPDAAHGRPDQAVGPSRRREQVRVPPGSSTSNLRMSEAIPATFCNWNHPRRGCPGRRRWRASRPPSRDRRSDARGRGCRGSPRAGERGRVAAVRLERPVARLGSSSRCRADRRHPGSATVPGVREVRVGEEVHRRAVLDRDAGGLDRRAWKHCDGVEAATIGTGLSPFRPKSTISRSRRASVGIGGRPAR